MLFACTGAQGHMVRLTAALQARDEDIQALRAAVEEAKAIAARRACRL